MTWTVLLGPEVARDLERFTRHLVEHEAADVEGRLLQLVSALDVLTHSPFIGRPAERGFRELVIGRGVRGYVARYHVDEATHVVFVAALRAQREADYRR